MISFHAFAIILHFKDIEYNHFTFGPTTRGGSQRGHKKEPKAREPNKEHKEEAKKLPEGQAKKDLIEELTYEQPKVIPND